MKPIHWMMLVAALTSQSHAATDEWRLGNDLLARRLSIRDGHLRTTSFESRSSGVSLPVASDEFVLRIGTNTLTTADFRFARFEKNRFTLTGPDDLEVEISYQTPPGKSYQHKWLIVRSRRLPALVLRDVQVEHFRVPTPTSLGGEGQPVFIGDRFFTGLEYPAAQNLQDHGLVTLEHYPGRPLTGAGLRTKTAVFGAATAGDLEGAFAAYLRDRRRPPRSLVVYNSWYDLRGGSLTVPALLGRQREMQRALVDQRGGHLDALVVDEGWEKSETIWEFNLQTFPHGFDELAAGLRGTKTAIGLWHPFAYYMDNNRTHKWAAAHGYELAHNGQFFCLTGPKYNAALRAAFRDKLQRYPITYFKHDFNEFNCAAPGHGHLPEIKYGREANVDAQIEMLRYLTSLREDVYLNPSGGLWLSPWWLLDSDTLWMDYCGDFGYLKTVPALEPRDWALTYRAQCLWMNLRRDRRQFPISAIMTIGIIDGQLNRLGGDKEPLDRWANNVMENLCYGSMLKELYITPGLLDDTKWDVLATAIKWQERHLEAMAVGRMIGGEPANGEVCGYFHPGRDTSVLCLRNPGMEMRTFDFTMPRDVARQPLIVYPYGQALELSPPGGTIHFELGPHELIVCELWRPAAMKFPFPKSGRFSIENRPTDAPREVVFRKLSRAGAPATVEPAVAALWSWKTRFQAGDRARFVAILRGADSKTRAGDYHVFLDDQELPLTPTEGEGWLALSAPLPAHRSATLRLERRGVATGPLSARLLVDEALAGTPVVLPMSRGSRWPVFPLTPAAHWQQRSLVLIDPDKEHSP